MSWLSNLMGRLSEPLSKIMRKPATSSSVRLGSNRERILLDRFCDLRRLRLDLEKLFSPEIGSTSLIHELDQLESALVNHLVGMRVEADKNRPLTVAVIGGFSSGKSTFINALLGADLCPTSIAPTTSVVTQFTHAEAFAVEQEMPDGTRTEISLSDYRARVQHGSSSTKEDELTFHIRCPSQILTKLHLLDTPGFENPKQEERDNARTMRAVRTADAIFFILDIACGNPTATLMKQCELVRAEEDELSQRPIFLLINKAETKPPSERAKIQKRCCTKEFSGRFRGVHLVSARELASGSDEPFLELLRRHFEGIERSIRRRERFDFSLNASKHESQGAYEVFLDGGSNSLPVAATADLATREDLVAMVEQVSRERIPLLAARFKRETDSLRIEWTRIVKKLSGWLEKRHAEAPKSRNAGEWLSDSIASTRTSVEEAVVEILKDASEAILSPAHELQKGIIFDDHHYRISIEVTGFEGTIQADSRWTGVSKELKKLTARIEREFDLSVCLDGDLLKDASLADQRNWLGEIRNMFGMHHSVQSRVVSEPAWIGEEAARNAALAERIEGLRARAACWAHELSNSVLSPELERVRDEVIRAQGERSANEARFNEEHRRLTTFVKTLKKSSL